jgi:nucleoside-diphosphate-sugar epimerase
VQAMLAGASKHGVAGQAFLISGQKPITWLEYLDYFARMWAKPSPPSVSSRRAKIESAWWRVYSRLTDRQPRIEPLDIVLMSNRSVVSIERARQKLGYEPSVPVDEGMRRSEGWLREEGHLPPSAHDPDSATPLYESRPAHEVGRVTTSAVSVQSL